MAKFTKGLKNRKSVEKPASENSFLKGALLGLLVSAAGSAVTGYVQYHYTRQQQETQLFLDEKKEFVIACNDYLTQFRTWHVLMTYYASKDYTDAGYEIGLTEFNRKSASEAYRKWKKDLDLSYGRMYLVSDNDFGEKTVIISNLFTNSLRAFATSDTLTVEQRWDVIHNIDEYFFSNWLNKAHDEILQYNKGVRNEKSLILIIMTLKRNIISRN